MNAGPILIFLVVVEMFLSLAYGYSEPFGQSRAKMMRASHEYVEHSTPQNKAAMDAEWERFYAPERRRNRFVLGLLIANSCLLAAVTYKLVRPKKQ